MVFKNAGVLCVATILKLGVSIRACVSTITAAMTAAMSHSPTHARVSVMTRMLRQIMTPKISRSNSLRAVADDCRPVAAYVLLLSTSARCCCLHAVAVNVNALFAVNRLDRHHTPLTVMSRGGVRMGESMCPNGRIDNRCFSPFFAQ